MAAPQLNELEGSFWGLSGDLTFATVADLLPAFSDRIEASRDCIGFDLGQVARADSAGLALLLEGMALARRKGCSIEYRNLPENLRDLARISNLGSMLES